jgi:hypothetical protein
VPVNLTGIEADYAAIKRAITAIDEILAESNAVPTAIAIGGEFKRLHDQLARNNKSDDTRIGWYAAFETGELKYSRRHAEDLITVHLTFVGSVLPTKLKARLPHAIRPLTLLARLLRDQELCMPELQGLLDAGQITPSSTENEIREILNLPIKIRAPAAPDIPP